VCSGKTTRMWQRSGPIGKEWHIRVLATESDQVPGAVDIRGGLEPADDRDRKHHGNRDEPGGPSPGACAGVNERNRPGEDRGRGNAPDEPSTTGMQDVARPPGAWSSTGPLKSVWVEVQGTSDERIEHPELENTEGGGKREERNPEVRANRCTVQDGTSTWGRNKMSGTSGARLDDRRVSYPSATGVAIRRRLRVRPLMDTEGESMARCTIAG
jgi:hypothetical protein